LWLAWLIENTREPCHREQLVRGHEIEVGATGQLQAWPVHHWGLTGWLRREDSNFCISESDPLLSTWP